MGNQHGNLHFKQIKKKRGNFTKKTTKDNCDFIRTQIDIIKNKYEKDRRTINSLAKEYKCTPKWLGKLMHEYNINIRHERYNNKYNVNINYFDDIDNEHKAYWLGFLLADGHISKKNKIMIGLGKKDEYMLSLFNRDLDGNYKIYYDNNKNPCITITSISLCNKLREYGFTNNKSYYFDIDKILNVIPSSLLHHFVRGMFDGDGSIKIYNYEYLKKPQYHFGYTGTYEVCNFIKIYLDLPRKFVKEGDFTYTIITGDKNKILEIKEKLYKDATIYLERKFINFNNI